MEAKMMADFNLTNRKERKMANIIKIARLITALEDTSRDSESKVRIIKMYRDMGIINEDDAIELVIEYC